MLVAVLGVLAWGNEGVFGPMGDHGIAHSGLLLEKRRLPEKPLICDQDFEDVMQDIHDGDQKKLEVRALDGRYTITPHGNAQNWKVSGYWSMAHCNASVDFNVQGKPAPPPVPLSLTYYNNNVRFAVFTDPSGKIAPRTTPVNAWFAV